MFWQLLLGYLLQVTTFAGGATDAVAGGSNALAFGPVVDSVTVIADETPHAPFTVQFAENESRYDVMAMFVVPNEVVPVSVTTPDGNTEGYQLTAAGGTARDAGDARWTWTAPGRPGLYPVEVRGPQGATMTLNVFVMVPYTAMRGSSLNGYRIGRYPRGRSEAYARPEGFVEVRPGMETVQVSPNFTIGQFLCKQAGGPPKYLVLRTPLLVKLEELLVELNDRGYEASTFQVMSAYRTPSYNAAIGNETSFSRHHYGDAADIYVDEDRDGRMDDLNRDGRHSLQDAYVLRDIVNQTQDDPEFEGLTGGLGTYKPNHSHGAFVHVDVRGTPARWGA